MRATAMKIHRHRRARQTFSILIALVFTGGIAAFAQSGRRSTSKPAPPAPPAVPKEVEAKTPTAPTLKFLVAAEDPNPFGTLASGYFYLVLDTCVERLAQAPGVQASAAEKRMNRSEAIKSAKAEKDRYVVWLQIGTEAIDSASQTANKRAQVYVTYFVFEPVTGKMKTWGHGYPGSYRVGNVGIAVPNSRNAVYTEYDVKQSAREAAEKVLASFQIK